ncbi:hypothetical protein B4U37_20070 [Sutcliffiella horikoshii]|uniref:Glycosyltransferase 2-like domain-containing protein n=1 Tax=Sutcliffiella horikoshii TaxID=79883 RepID=A0ABM6KNX7_9BACI|nr:glycosyltransferase [Sutcliffiella horikoshii]ART78198.1 hypothetical protein B4U37_20070 [Sutcliffiella horikoshii]
MYHFTFVILHYLVKEDTIECIESILSNIDYLNYNIIVVDNCSPNGSGIELKEKYSMNAKVKIILNGENEGFARGNNIGYKLGKYEYNSDFIMVVNNDTVIKQRAFINKVINEYETFGFDILGPDIISLKDNNHQNPVGNSVITKEQLYKIINVYKRLLILNYIGVEGPLRKIMQKKIKKRQLDLIGNNDHENIQYNVQLHGSCLIFSKGYIERFEGFFDKTFMYMEEDILYYLANRDGLKTMYSPNVVIYHKEDSSTDATYSKNKKKRRFKYKNVIQSAEQFLKLMNGEIRY